MRARIAVFASALALAVGCAQTGAPAIPPAAAPGPVALRNADFEAPGTGGPGCPVGWGCSAHNRPEAFKYGVDSAHVSQGRLSASIERNLAEPWALVVQSVPVDRLKGQRIRLTISVRHEGAGGGIGPFVKAQNGVGVAIGAAQQVVPGPTDWKRVSVEFDVPRDTMVLEVGALREGAGRSWLDDAVLEVLGPGSR
ncbi:MAG TPA: hypothetical protein PLD37_01645 [Usitatibacteraceae bacterium]|nr:hypothetical protein [Usitatibacteraceae bacterium]